MASTLPALPCPRCTGDGGSEIAKYGRAFFSGASRWEECALCEGAGEVTREGVLARGVYDAGLPDSWFEDDDTTKERPMITIQQIEELGCAVKEYRRDRAYSWGREAGAKRLVSAWQPLLDIVDTHVDTVAARTVTTLRGLIAETTDIGLRHDLERALDKALVALADSIVALPEPDIISEPPAAEESGPAVVEGASSGDEKAA